MFHNRPQQLIKRYITIYKRNECDRLVLNYCLVTM